MRRLFGNHLDRAVVCYRLSRKALGLQCGKLASGQKADIIGFRLPTSYSGPWLEVPFESNRREVDFYMVDGKASNHFPDNLSN